MPQSLAKLYTHIIFSTKKRFPFFQDNKIRNETYKYIASILKSENSLPIIINGTKDHIHILCNISKDISVASLIVSIKRSSSKWLKSKKGIFSKFYWQKGYGAFSISESIKDTTINYIRNQSQHHKIKTFKDEFIEILESYRVDYDRKYLWD